MSIHAGKLGIIVASCQNFAGNEPPFAKIKASDLGIVSCYVNAISDADYAVAHPDWVDRFVTPELIDKIGSNGLLPCVWFVPRTMDAAKEANRLSAAITKLDAKRPVAAVMLDVETHDVGFQRAFLSTYRMLRPGRATDWTMEPRQSTSTVIASEIVAARMDLFPQLYRDNMRDADPKHELRYWADQVGWDHVHLALDAATNWWALGDGILFDAERLP